ncbi:MAG: hypothetical protein M1422_02505 [Candidatus Thermoplasmatota archaeon]|nr:hypothetical protein [Candidatus Thermoplasmatota archaeon]MCL5253381.1 hypothetical protein [Candidatus Thermoplasmatota archaeon]
MSLSDISNVDGFIKEALARGIGVQELLGNFKPLLDAANTLLALDEMIHNANARHTATMSRMKSEEEQARARVEEAKRDLSELRKLQIPESDSYACLRSAKDEIARPLPSVVIFSHKVTENAEKRGEARGKTLAAKLKTDLKTAERLLRPEERSAITKERTEESLRIARFIAESEILQRSGEPYLDNCT